MKKIYLEDDINFNGMYISKLLVTYEHINELLSLTSKNIQNIESSISVTSCWSRPRLSSYIMSVFKFLCLDSFCTFRTLPSVASKAAVIALVPYPVGRHLLFDARASKPFVNRTSIPNCLDQFPDTLI